MLPLAVPAPDVAAVHHEQPPWAEKGAALLANIPWRAPLRLSAPCVGLNAGHRACCELGRDTESVNVYDEAPDLRVPLAALHPATEIHVGQAAGDIIPVSCDDLEPCDALFAGPPCPPYSDMGLHGEASDRRSLVFAAVLNWIVALVATGMSWFVLENVTGMVKRRHGDDESFADKARWWMDVCDGWIDGWIDWWLD